ncbi:MAG: type II secretion system protein M [Pseudomonadales bacterium]|nr:type II secretion system protein M [Pseudomonadales bacterium]
MKNWFLSLTERDKKIVAGLGVSMFFLLVFTFLWMPISEDNQQLEKRIKRSQADLVWMQQSAEKIKALGPVSNSGASGKKSSNSMLTTIETTAAAQGIKLKKITPKKNNQVEIRLSDVSFNSAINWISVLKIKHGVLVSKFSAEKLNEGRVNLTLLLQG